MDRESKRIGEYVAQARFDDMPPEAIASAKRSTLDTLGAMLAGSTAAGIDTVVNMSQAWGGAKQAHVVGFGHQLPAPLAAWCNGTMARALEIDDCVDFLPVHPSASAVPALLTLGELKGGLTGRKFLTALAVGQDLIIRMGLALKQNAMQSGRNNLFKIFGPTAALAKAMGFGPQEARNALGLSFSFAVGDGQCALDGALSLRLQQGIVAQGALLSVLLTSQGFSGAQDFLLGKYGYLKAFEPDPRLEYLSRELGRKWYGEQITIKPFSACRATHASIELSLRLGNQTKLDPERIRRITVRTCPEVCQLVGEPRAQKIKPQSVTTAQFSIQYTVAAALMQGDFFLKELEPEFLHNRKILDLARRVYVEPDPLLRTDLVLGKTQIEIESEGQPALKQTIELPLGNPARPMDYEACAEKFIKSAAYSVKPIESARLQEVIAMVADMENLQDVTPLMGFLY